VKSIYMERERQTAEDLLQLEKLHSARVTKLETTLASTKQALTEAEKAIEKLRKLGTNMDDSHQRDRERYFSLLLFSCACCAH
jgi:superfamily I DNA/RNA helicase